jgi:hypothetical protein
MGFFCVYTYVRDAMTILVRVRRIQTCRRTRQLEPHTRLSLAGKRNAYNMGSLVASDKQQCADFSISLFAVCLIIEVRWTGAGGGRVVGP